MSLVTELQMLMLNAELRVHRKLLLDLHQQSNPAKTPAMCQQEIMVLVNHEVEKQLASMADASATGATALANLWKALKAQQQPPSE